MLSVTMLLCAAPAAASAADLLPVQWGRYAPAGQSCDGGDILAYDGQSIGPPGVRQCLSASAKAGSSTFRITETCSTPSGPRVQETTYRVTGRSAFIVLAADRRGGAHYRRYAPPPEPELLRGWLP